MKKHGTKIMILLDLLLGTSFLFLKKPLKEYFDLKNENNEQLSKKLIQLTYSHFWRERGFSLTGDCSLRESTVIILKKGNFRVINKPFSKSGATCFTLLYNEKEPYISVDFHLKNNEATYNYQENSTSELKSVSLNHTNAKSFIESTGSLSENALSQEVKRTQVLFIHSLREVKDQVSGELQTQIVSLLISLGAFSFLAIVLFTLFSLIKV